tara:strand:- start:186 stop:1568 length:1383 start_codon:yes stop_codon:yes gene_type:complete
MLVESFSGIRGIYKKHLNEDIARKYAFAYSQLLKKDPKIVIGTDTRASAEPLKQAIVDIFKNIIDLGIATTPMTELAVREYKADGGIIITASHNEPEWNGFKFLDSDGAVLSPKKASEVIKNFHKIKDLKEEEFLDRLHKKDPTTHKIQKQHEDIKARYYNFIINTIGKKHIEKIKKLKTKVLIDPNGGAGITNIDILKKINKNFIGINTESGKFKRKIEPNENSLSYLKDILKKHNADFAAGFDCDADRVEILLKDGNIVSGQYVLALVVDNILEELKPPQTIVVNDATSYLIKEIADKHKAKVIETEVGEINVVDEMVLNKSPIGGEGSSAGAIIPPSRCRDGILTLLSILKLIAKRNQPLTEIIKEYPIYHTLKDKASIKPEKTAEIKQKIKQFYLKKGFRIQETGPTGGLKIITKDAFLWFRQSKTEPGTIRIMTDSKSKEKALSLLKEGKTFINT